MHVWPQEPASTAASSGSLDPASTAASGATLVAAASAGLRSAARTGLRPNAFPASQRNAISLRDSQGVSAHWDRPKKRNRRGAYAPDQQLFRSERGVRLRLGDTLEEAERAAAQTVQQAIADGLAPQPSERALRDRAEAHKAGRGKKRREHRREASEVASPAPEAESPVFLISPRALA